MQTDSVLYEIIRIFKKIATILLCTLIMTAICYAVTYSFDIDNWFVYLFLFWLYVYIKEIWFDDDGFYGQKKLEKEINTDDSTPDKCGYY